MAVPALSVPQEPATLGLVDDLGGHHEAILEAVRSVAAHDWGSG